MAIEVTGMAPLLQVYDMNEALAFYQDALGFEMVADSGEVDTPEGRYCHWCWLRLGDADLMLNTAYDAGERPPARDPAREAGHDDLCLYFSVPDVDATASFLRARGLEVEGPRTAPYGMRQTWLHDPDGYQLCFQARAAGA
ncbi:MAG TPA: VOC family protein [Allosphingosinicella sp.]|nr:VOC family protein [Allosphingosinicella sp.]